MRVFVDTTVWVSAIACPGLCDELLKQLFRNHEVLGSELVWTEVAAVLARKLGFAQHEIDAALAMYSETIQVADVSAPRKDSDVRLVAAAANGGIPFCLSRCTNGRRCSRAYRCEGLRPTVAGRGRTGRADVRLAVRYH